MEHQSLIGNAAFLDRELRWLTELLEMRLGEMAGREVPSGLMREPPSTVRPVSVYRDFVRAFELNAEERIILLLALLPYLDPYLFERTLRKFGLDGSQIPQIGGVRGSWHGGFIPTGETALFLLAGNDLKARLKYILYFSPAHKFYSRNILRLEEVSPYEPELSGALVITKDVVHMLTTATAYKPAFNTNFPARLLTTDYDFGDLVLPKETEEQISEIDAWLRHSDVLLNTWGFGKKMSSGYKCLFYGPSGTGKSLTVALIGKRHQIPVYRIDLSMVISKYIGETEKNLSKVFDTAARKKWILFFDEADALFGKRSNIQSANDRFANQEVSYLLMRMEEYDGLAILATNLKRNIDNAFLRRFQLVVHFPAPDRSARLRLWKQSFSSSTVFADDVDLNTIAEHFSLTGAHILNVARFASMAALTKGNNIITRESIMDGIRRELAKEASLTSEVSTN